MAAAGQPPSRSFKLFLLGLTAFLGGTLPLGLGFVVQAMGSMDSATPEAIGLVLIVAGILLAGGELGR